MSKKNGKKPKIISLISILILIFSFAVVLKFLLGNQIIEEFHSDMAEIVLWANASIESGSLLNPNFNYSYTIPFGGQLLFIPIVKLFGVSLRTYRLGMTLIFLLFSVILYFFFRSFGWNRSESSVGTSLMILSFSATKKLREIFWGHVIHYSLAVFFLLLAFIFLNLCYRSETKRRRTIAYVLLCITVFFGSAEGPTLVLFFSIIFISSCWIDFLMEYGVKFPRETHSLLFQNILITLSGGLGCFCYRKLTHGFPSVYSDSYSILQPAENWAQNALSVISHWISLFGEMPSEKVSVYSLQGIRTSLAIFCGVVFFFLPFILMKQCLGAYERRLCIAHCLLFIATLYFYIFGSISDKNWRLIPLVSTSVICVLIIGRRVIKNNSFMDSIPSFGMFLIAGAILLGANSFNTGFAILTHKPDLSIWFDEGGVLDTLKAHKLTYGYTTDYWFGNSITLLTGEGIRVRQVGLDENGLNSDPIQVDRTWYEDQPDQDLYFLLCFEEEYQDHPELAENATEMWRCSNKRTYDTWHTHEAGFIIFVYDFNIMEIKHGKNFRK